MNKPPTKVTQKSCFLCQDSKPVKEIYTLTAPNKEMRFVCASCITDFFAYIRNGNADDQRVNRSYDPDPVPF